jgi:hypothetical protein
VKRLQAESQARGAWLALDDALAVSPGGLSIVSHRGRSLTYTSMRTQFTTEQANTRSTSKQRSVGGRSMRATVEFRSGGRSATAELKGPRPWWRRLLWRPRPRPSRPRHTADAAPDDLEPDLEEGGSDGAGGHGGGEKVVSSSFGWSISQVSSSRNHTRSTQLHITLFGGGGAAAAAAAAAASAAAAAAAAAAFSLINRA